MLISTSFTLSVLILLFSIKLTAPSFVALTAFSIVPLPEIMITGKEGYFLTVIAKASKPSKCDVVNSISNNNKDVLLLCCSKYPNASSGELQQCVCHPNPLIISAIVAVNS